ncbi:MAG: reverse transcriptase domain-containing protein [Nanoarchaeota archaeon]|nr:reverse transcriptase domain-containing protein [Nanoarchaeota archaeon]
MNTDNLYDEIISMKNLFLAYKKAKKGKTKKDYVKRFEENLISNLKTLNNELKNQTYKPAPLKTFILRDPKTRKISKSAFRDRIVHHALIRIIEPIFDKIFIYDSCANRIGKGTLFAIKRFDRFKRKVTCNLRKEAFCLKADIKHYFQEMNREVLIRIIQEKIKCIKTTHLIRLILDNFNKDTGMPLGNLTSQFFANVYLNELDYFIKHRLKIEHYIRYVDDFIILHGSREQLEIWKLRIDKFLEENLKIELHKEKSKIISLSRGVDFVGFRNFYHFRLLRKRNIKKMNLKIKEFNDNKISKEKFVEILQGWNAYTKWSNSYQLKEKFVIKSPPS